MNVSWKILNSHTLGWFSLPQPPFYKVNLYTFCIDNKLFFIDSGPYPSIFESLVKKLPDSWLNLEPILIITHHDFDHSLGHTLSFLDKNVQIYAHKEYKSLMNIYTLDWLKKHLNKFPNLPKELSPMPTIEIENCHCITDNVMLIPTPGHTKDSISVFEKTTGALFVGDAVEFENIPYLGDSGSLCDWLKTIETLISLNSQVLYLGHGQPEKPSKLLEFKKYFLNLKNGHYNLSNSRLFKGFKQSEALEIHQSNIQKVKAELQNVNGSIDN